jgi:hypothetical protein
MLSNDIMTHVGQGQDAATDSLLICLSLHAWAALQQWMDMICAGLF